MNCYLLITNKTFLKFETSPYQIEDLRDVGNT